MLIQDLLLQKVLIRGGASGGKTITATGSWCVQTSPEGTRKRWPPNSVRAGTNRSTGSRKIKLPDSFFTSSRNNWTRLWWQVTWFPTLFRKLVTCRHSPVNYFPARAVIPTISTCALLPGMDGMRAVATRSVTIRVGKSRPFVLCDVISAAREGGKADKVLGPEFRVRKVGRPGR